ncbi:ABC transporter ATP-binding protein [Oceanobacillus chungangensis]|uniref:Multidrug ABC transporter ATP-binding protein n=1 Tax=Oceanobacillus chungangensis TaxID=1229152 RepID=A0A3D8PLA8_9BACI|nr:ABC transporter ATP-binding protein [Oceanobacillus chungangensis]RDW15965.1 multidrug ABC transporter ATP-binding protein [Oceanobacillus chungangensis]
MSNNELKAPFQYKKIPVNQDASKDKKKAKNMTGTLLRIWSYLVREKVKLSLVILMVTISSGLSLLGPYLVGTTIDKFIVTREISGFGLLLISLLIVYLFHSLSLFLQSFWMIGIAQNTVFDLRKDLFRQFHRLPISYFDKRQHGNLMSRLTNDIDNVNNVLNSSVIQIFSSVLTLVGTLVVMLMLSPILTFVTMIIIPLMYFATRWITKRTGPLYKMQQKDLGDINGYIEEVLSGQHVVQTYSQEKRVIHHFEQKNNQLKLTGFWAQNIAGFIPKVMNTLNFLSFGLIALVGGILSINTSLVTVGMIVIFIEYSRQFTRPLNELSNQFNLLLSAVAGAERVFNVMDETPEEDDEEDALEIKSTSGHIIFDNVSFAYESTLILKNISFEAKPGETIAFVGHTGAGKTTIINLISRFYNYDGGSIKVDGNELNKIKRSSLRKHMAFVLQEPFLFQGTIRDNIRYGQLEATDFEVEKAAKDANAHEFINQLPNGYDTILDHEGSGISQGQKQLLTIARALIAEPSILIFDEATSNIDTITEIKIQDALHRLMSGRTSFVIAHRLNTIQDADQIIMLEHGEIVEKGNHEALIKQEGHYYQLYKGQLVEEANKSLE